MSGPTPKCRVLVAHQSYRVGDPMEPGAMLRNDLLRRGWIEIIEEKVSQHAGSMATGVLPVGESPIKKRGRPRTKPPIEES